MLPEEGNRQKWWLAPQKVLEALTGRVVNPQMPQDGAMVSLSSSPLSHPPPLGLTDKQHSFAHRGQVFSSKPRAEFVSSLDAPLFTPHCQNHASKGCPEMKLEDEGQGLLFHPLLPS